MADPRTPPRPKVTGKQWLLIGLLAVILVIVLVVQFGGGSGSGRGEAAKDAAQPAAGASSSEKPSAEASAAPRAKGSSTSVSAPRRPARPWPTFTAESAAQHDPFAMPEVIARKLAKNEEAEPENKKTQAARRPINRDQAAKMLRTKGVRAVLRNEGGAIAVVGSQEVRVGDVLEGFRVMSIDSDGVLLAPSDASQRREDRP